MSQYVNFFVVKDNVEIPVFNFCRSSEYYTVFQEYLPYGRAIKVTDEIVDEVIAEMNGVIEMYEENVREYEMVLKNVHFASIEDARDGINEMLSNIREYKERIKECQEVKNFASVIGIMVDDLKYEDGDCGVYAGIEVGSVFDNGEDE